MRLRQFAIYLWTSPTTAVGFPFVIVALLTGGKARVVDGVIEVHSGALKFLLRRVFGFFLPAGASAITFGHIVLARDQDLLNLTRSHERVHVRQAERWGIFFLPAYLLASLIALLRGRHFYRDNYFERQAFDQAR